MPNWDVQIRKLVKKQVLAAPDAVRLEAYRWIFDRLPRDPWEPPHVDPLRNAQKGSQKGLHVRLGGAWRLIYVAFPLSREVYVYDVVEHKDDTLYSSQYVRRMHDFARKRRNPEATAVRIEAAMAAHPEAGDHTVAKLAGCAPQTVRNFRVARGIPARHTLAWKPWLAKKQPGGS